MAVLILCLKQGSSYNHRGTMGFLSDWTHQLQDVPQKVRFHNLVSACCYSNVSIETKHSILVSPVGTGNYGQQEHLDHVLSQRNMIVSREPDSIQTITNQKKLA